MTLWDICRVRLGGHMTKTEGYDSKTPPLLRCGSFFPPNGAGQKSSLRLPRAQPPSAGPRPTGEEDAAQRRETSTGRDDH